MRSMTGFGIGQAANERYRITAQIRSVNHRYLDLLIRLKESYRSSEGRVRTLLESNLSRGRVEVSFEIVPLVRLAPKVAVQSDVLQSFLDDLEKAIQHPLLEKQLSLGELLRVPDLLMVEPTRLPWHEEDETCLLDVVTQALTELQAARDQEGEALLSGFLRGLDSLGEYIHELSSLRQQVRDELFKSLRERLAETADEFKFDESRLEQEVVLLVDRSDVQEELDRLSSHSEQFRTILRADGSVGRKLDFLCQEILRELNTIGAKCRQVAMANRVIDAKVVCEQLREQAQNVE